MSLIGHVVIVAVLLSTAFSIAAIYELERQQRAAFGDRMRDRTLPKNTPEYYLREFRRQQREDEYAKNPVKARDSATGLEQKFRDATLDQLLVADFCYMDEIFHVPAAWRYGVDKNWTYLDPMITTPPGAYVVAAGALSTWAWLRSLSANVCDKALAVADVVSLKNCDRNGAVMAPTTALMLFADGVTLMRSTNVVLHLATLVTAYGIANRLHPNALLGNLIFSATVALIPTLNFFTVLFYTDVLSMLLVMMILRVAPGRSGSGPSGRGFRVMTMEAHNQWAGVALLGIAAILVRQTNIVWLFFAAARHVVAEAFAASATTRGSSVKAGITATLKWSLQLAPVIAVAAGFLLFVFVANGGNIVLGDASNHKPSTHGAQLVYFFLFAAAVAPLSSTYNLLAWLFSKKSPVAIVSRSMSLGVVFLIFATLVERSVVAHPYILADNRHFTFYFYRRFVAARAVRLTILPALATLGAVPFVRMLLGTAETAEITAAPGAIGVRAKMVLDAILFAVCLLVAVVPQGLIEFR